MYCFFLVVFGLGLGKLNCILKLVEQTYLFTSYLSIKCEKNDFFALRMTIIEKRKCGFLLIMHTYIFSTYRQETIK